MNRPGTKVPRAKLLIAVYLAPSMVARLDRKAREEGRKRSQMISRMIEKYLECEPVAA